MIIQKKYRYFEGTCLKFSRSGRFRVEMIVYLYFLIVWMINYVLTPLFDENHVFLNFAPIFLLNIRIFPTSQKKRKNNIFLFRKIKKVKTPKNFFLTSEMDRSNLYKLHVLYEKSFFLLNKYFFSRNIFRFFSIFSKK